jgi:cyclic-di-GMP-binding protein
MAAQNSFDVVSEIDLAEVKNAVNQANKEVVQRYDLKGSKAEITLDEKARQLVLESDSEFTLEAVLGILQQKLVRRAVPLKALDYGKPLPAGGDRVRQTIQLQQGIPTEKAREIVKLLKEQKLKKVQAAIQGDSVRISGPDRDTLQEVIALLKAHDFGIHIAFDNYRS